MARLISITIVIFLLFGCSQTGIQLTGNIKEQEYINQSGNLYETLQENEIPAEYALVIAADGTAFFVSEKSFSEIQITKENGNFNSTSSTLPPVCNLKDIIEICLYNSNYPIENHKTPFSWRLANFKFLGQNSRNGHFVRKYKLKESS